MRQNLVHAPLKTISPASQARRYNVNNRDNGLDRDLDAGRARPSAPPVSASQARGTAPVLGAELEYSDNVQGFLIRVGFGRGDENLGHAWRVHDKLMGDLAEDRVQTSEIAKRVEQERYANMATLRRPRRRAGKPDDGVPVFGESLPDGVKDVTLRPAIAKAMARGWGISNVFVKQMVDGKVFMYIWFEPTARQAYSDKQVAAIVAFLSDSVFSFLHLWENTASSGSMTANVPFNGSFWKSADQRQAPARDFDFVGDTWQGVIVPNAAWLAKRQDRDARPDRRPHDSTAAANLRDRRDNGRR